MGLAEPSGPPLELRWALPWKPGISGEPDGALPAGLTLVVGRLAAGELDIMWSELGGRRRL